MSNLASSAVTELDSHMNITVPGGKSFTRSLELVLTGQGGATNKIQASVLRFNTITNVSMATKSDNSEALPAAASYDGSLLFLLDDNNAPADATGTYRIRVTGSPV